MSCEICFNLYDHSIHKPYMLSCPHTFCLECVNKFKTKKCPSCDAHIKAKNPNIALLQFVPESLYDRLKLETQKTLNEISDLRTTLKIKRESKLNKYADELSSIRNSIKNETTKLVYLLKANEAKLLEEVTKIEESLEENLTSSQAESETETKLIDEKRSVESNELNEQQLANLVEDSAAEKTKIEELFSAVEEFKEKIEFEVHEFVSPKDGLIGEIWTNEKVKNFPLKSKQNKTNQF